MSEFIMHGDEEAIERASEEFYPVLAEHISHKTGRIEQSGLVNRRIDAARWRLHSEGLDFQDIELGRVYACQIMRDCVEIQREIAVREQTSGLEI